jgi:sodium transport system permease protein
VREVNLKHVWIVFAKEVRDIARDKRTLITNLVVPIILMPLLFSLMGGGMKKMEQDITENVTVALTQESNTEEIRSLVQQDIFANYPNIKLVDSFEDPMDAIRKDEVRFVLDIDKDYKNMLEEGKTFSINVLYDQSDTKSSGSFGILAEAINQYNQKIVRSRLKEMEIDPQILEPVKIEQSNAAEKDVGSNLMLMMILPMLASILIAVGGIPAATDLAAGEKERGTFEPLLTTQAGRMSILAGKYLTVTLFSVVSVVAQLIGVIIGSIISPGFLTMGVPDAELSISIPPAALALSILITITLGMVFSAIQLAISTYAKSFKEAQTYLSFLIFVAMVPGYATMMLQPDDLKLYMFLVPVLNAIASLKMVLGSVINYAYLGIALGTSAIYVIISLIFAASMFNKEKYLFRS